MARTIISSAIVTLLIGSVAMGDITERQTLDIGAIGGIDLCAGSFGCSTLNQTVGGQLCQTATGVYCTMARQRQQGDITQIGSANGMCGGLVVYQEAGGGDLPVGRQVQSIGDCCGPATQNQRLGFGAQQILDKTGCAMGTACGDQTITLSQGQYASNAIAQMGEHSTIEGSQQSHLSGGAGNVTALIAADSTQFQSVQ